MDFESKITRTKNYSLSSLSKAKKSKSTSGGFELIDVDSTDALQSPPSVSSVSSLSALQNLEALQGITYEDPKQDLSRGSQILDLLEGVRQELLIGEISLSRLETIETLVGQHRVKTLEPNLVELLNDIDLRAKVEIAKYEQ